MLPMFEEITTLVGLVIAAAMAYLAYRQIPPRKEKKELCVLARKLSSSWQPLG
jgi:uncharacterized membrane protein YccC